MSTESITQKQFNFGKQESLKVGWPWEKVGNFCVQKQRVLNSSIVDSGSDTDSLIDSPLANRPVFQNFRFFEIISRKPVNSSVCALCNVSKHHLGQGELNRYAPSAGFDPFQSSQAHLESSSGISQISVGLLLFSSLQVFSFTLAREVFDRVKRSQGGFIRDTKNYS